MKAVQRTTTKPTGSRIARRKERIAHLVHKVGHVVDLASDLVVAAPV
jgi:hypothetical protein